MAWSPDGKTLACGTGNGIIHLWDGKTLQLKSTITPIPNGKAIVQSLRFSSDSKVLVAALTHRSTREQAVDPQETCVYFFDPANSKEHSERERILLDGETVGDMALSPDGKTLVTLSGSIEPSVVRRGSRLRLWKLSEPKATPPKPESNTGRLTLWAGDTLVHMEPDGTDVQTVDLPKDTLASIGYGDGVRLAPDRKSFAVLRITKQLGGNGDMESKLSVVPLDGAGKARDVEGYVPRLFFSFDGQKVCFYGATGTVRDADARSRAACYEYDSKTGLVTRMPIPDHHYIHAGSTDGKRTIYGGPVTADDRTTWRTFVAGPDGKKPFEILGPNTFLGL